MERAKHPLRCTFFKRERILEENISHDVQRDGERYLSSFETVEPDILMNESEVDDHWYTDTVSDLRDIMTDLRETGFIQDLQ